MTAVLGNGLTASAQDGKYNMSYIFFGGSSQYTKLVDGTQGSLHEVSPNYFALDADGGLLLTSAVSSGFVRDMHDRGILVIPHIANDWDRAVGIAALNRREALANELAVAVSAYDLDGVNVDMENLTPDEREEYVDFTRLLRAKLPKEKKITVSVAANPYGTSSGWQGSYDYAGLAAYCDYLMIMAYDESYYGSDPGPVSSLSFMEKSIQYAIRFVPKEQIVLGLPFYGRIWSSDGGFPYGYGVSGTSIDMLLDEYDGTVELDEDSRSAYATITVEASDTKPKINGQSLSAGTYVIWYCGEQSLKSALSLVTKYDIKGTGSWSLGQEESGTWDYYKLWLNGCSFSDIQVHWAKEEILDVFLKGWMNGLSSCVFAPDGTLTRAQAAVILVRMAGLTAETDSAYGFEDCGGSWARAYIETARKQRLVAGVGNNLFEPERAVTRAEIAVMLNNVLNYADDGGRGAFYDVTEAKHAWACGAIRALSAQGVITGYPDGSFKPDSHVTRAEIAAMAARIGSAG
jgi:spore germination protein YaaH